MARLAGTIDFRGYDACDSNGLAVYLGLIWFGMLMGFVPEMARHMTDGEPAYPIIVHLHAVAFVGWLVLFTTQMTLIRAGRRDLHRRLGLAGAVLAAAMIVLGPAVALVIGHRDLTSPNPDAAFLSVQFTDILAFAGLIAAGLLLRRDAAAHKRLMLLGTLYITDAGWGRWLGVSMQSVLGNGYLPMLTELYLPSNLLILGVGLWDYTTRNRLHPVYLPALLWIVANELAAVWFYMLPAWEPVATRLLGG